MPAEKTLLWTEAFYRAVDPALGTIGFHRAYPGWRSPPKADRKREFDLWYIAKGGGAVKIDGIWVPFAAGDLVTIKPGQVYQQERANESDPFETYFAHILPFGPNRPRLTQALAQVWPTKVSVRHHPPLGTFFEELFATHTAQPTGYLLPLRAAALRILDLVFSILRQPGAAVLPPAYPRLLAAKEYIERSYDQNPTLDRIAREARLSPSYLSGLFRRYFGTSPVEYRIDCQLRFTRLLLAKGIPASRSAEAAGFSSLHYFSRMFRRRYGLAPSEFARSCRRE